MRTAILGIACTEADAGARSSASPKLLRVGQALAAFYGLAGVALPVTRRQVWQGVLIDQPVFYLFAVPFFISIAFALAGTVHVFRSRIDPSEKVRLRLKRIANQAVGANRMLSRVTTGAASARAYGR